MQSVVRTRHNVLTEWRRPVGAGGGRRRRHRRRSRRRAGGARGARAAVAGAVVVIAVLGQRGRQFVGRRRPTVGRLENGRRRRHCRRGHVRYLCITITSCTTTTVMVAYTYLYIFFGRVRFYTLVLCDVSGRAPIFFSLRDGGWRTERVREVNKKNKRHLSYTYNYGRVHVEVKSMCNANMRGQISLYILLKIRNACKTVYYYLQYMH